MVGNKEIAAEVKKDWSERVYLFCSLAFELVDRVDMYLQVRKFD
jgi:hypothetical protein